MIVLFSELDDWSDRLDALRHEAHASLRVAGDWAEVQGAMAAARALILALRAVDGRWARRVGDLSRAFPLTPVVVVAPWAGEAARMLSLLPAAEVLHPAQSAEAVVAAVERADATPLLERVARAVERRDDVEPLLRRAVADACRADPPVHTVNRLAAHAGVSRSSLWSHWRERHHPPPSVRLEDLLHRIELIRALEDGATGVPRAETALRLGVSERTLRRRFGRYLPGRSWNAAPVRKRRWARRVAAELLSALDVAAE